MATEVDLNRWREAGKEIGRKIGVVEERERIIKLLEECLDHDYNVPSKDGWSGKMHHLDVFCTACRAVALIKGENK